MALLRFEKHLNNKMDVEQKTSMILHTDIQGLAAAIIMS